jgi:hypothetical protein
VATVSLRIAALGTCRPGADAGVSAGAEAGASFDMLACRYQPTAAGALGAAP